MGNQVRNKFLVTCSTVMTGKLRAYTYVPYTLYNTVKLYATDRSDRHKLDMTFTKNLLK